MSSILQMSTEKKNSNRSYSNAVYALCKWNLLEIFALIFNTDFDGNCTTELITMPEHFLNASHFTK